MLKENGNSEAEFLLFTSINRKISCHISLFYKNNKSVLIFKI